VVADPGALIAAGRGVMTVAPGSLPDYLSVDVGSAPPAWIRPVQLAAGLAATAAGVVRDRPLEGLLLCFTVRALVDPNPAPAYSIPLVVIAMAVDTRYARPVTLPLAAASFWLSQPVLDGGTGLLRLVVLVVLAVLGTAMLFSRDPDVGPARAEPAGHRTSESA
jgi:hypothetical protein